MSYAINAHYIKILAMMDMVKLVDTLADFSSARNTTDAYEQFVPFIDYIFYFYILPGVGY